VYQQLAIVNPRSRLVHVLGIRENVATKVSISPVPRSQNHGGEIWLMIKLMTLGCTGWQTLPDGSPFFSQIDCFPSYLKFMSLNGCLSKMEVIFGNIAWVTCGGRKFLLEKKIMGSTEKVGRCDGHRAVFWFRNPSHASVRLMKPEVRFVLYRQDPNLAWEISLMAVFSRGSCHSRAVGLEAFLDCPAPSRAAFSEFSSTDLMSHD
jgi:hypothetical protein